MEHRRARPGQRIRPEETRVHQGRAAAFFKHCDNEVARIRAFGRKGWLPAFRDAMLFKTAYAYGLRRNETRMLEAADFGRNPHGEELGEFGLCRVRFGKAKKGSPPKRRSVLTVFGWTPEILEEWFTEAARCSAPTATRPPGPPNAGRGSAASASTPGSSPAGRPSARTTGWISIP
ncbi:MAG: hypothetical protein ABSA02_10840 [Trebonia sp.]